MKKRFTDWTPGVAKTRKLLAQVEGVIESYQRQGYQLTLRQLYYQLVARGMVPNENKMYKRLGDLVNNARLGGLIDWDSIVDRGRVPIMPSSWAGPAAILDSAAYGYRLDRWQGQANYVEIWCEKDALSSVIEPVCNTFHIRFLADRGYASATAVYDGAKRFEEAATDGKTPYLIYLGDHDPSGVDMTRDVKDRLELMTMQLGITVRRIALNYDQVEFYNPPPNPTKFTDSRAEAYAAEYGNESWELDALEPQVLTDLLTDAVEELLDVDLYEEVKVQEETDKAELYQIAAELRRRG